METTEFSSATNVRMVNRNIGVAQYGNDSGLIVKFTTEPHLDAKASQEAGRPIYQDRPYIHILFPGDKTRQILRPVDMKGKNGKLPDPIRFPQQWAAYQNQQSDVHIGTPLDQWGPMSRSEALNYKGFHIHTVEELSAVSDSSLGGMGHGARTWRDKAIAWIATTKDSAVTMKLTQENATLKNDLEALKQQVAELANKPKRGRPPKVTDDGSA